MTRRLTIQRLRGRGKIVDGGFGGSRGRGGGIHDANDAAKDKSVSYDADDKNVEIVGGGQEQGGGDNNEAGK